MPKVLLGMILRRGSEPAFRSTFVWLAVITRANSGWGLTLVALVKTVAYLGLEARSVEVQCSVAPGLPKFNIVGLADKAVGESKERVRAALSGMGLALPPKRITINLSPADLPKEGSHYDLPIALALLAALGSRMRNSWATGSR